MDMPAPTTAESPRLLPGYKALVIGVANEHSIAWGCAKALRKAGADVAMTYVNDKTRTYTEPLAQNIEAPIFMPLQVHDTVQMDALFERIGAEWGRLDTLIHSIAFAPKEALQGRVTDCPRDGFLTAMEVSCWSFIDLARRSEPLMREGGTMICMSYLGANQVVENYGIMGPVKAALEATTRYLAAELGPKGIRVHAVSPGPLATRAASSIRDFDELMARVSSRAPVHRLVTIEEGRRRLCVPCQPLCRRDDRRDPLHRRRLPHPRLTEPSVSEAADQGHTPLGDAPGTYVLQR